MCKMASYFHRKTEANGLEIKVWDLTSHGATQEHFGLTDKAGWFEGHYTPQDEVECRIPEGRDSEREDEIRRRYPKFKDFLIWALTQDIGGNLDLSRCKNIP